MNDADSEPDQLNQLAYEFAERFRRGERPSLTEYATRHPALAAEIRDLFPAMALIERFGSIAGPASGPAIRTATSDGAAPRQLGEYRILREVARGGMGIVYEAVQESLGRHVALKVLPFQSLANATHRERFRREARAAANLHHTNIVPVFGVGEHDGIHYFAMQFIQGQALDSVLNEVNRLRRARVHRPDEPTGASASLADGLLTGHFPAADAATPVAPISPGSTQGDDGSSASNVLSSGSGFGGLSDGRYFRSVAQIGVQVADALAYAHQQGILHRDVKPSNLLLDRQGTVWVTDFGLAKSEGTDELTTPGDFVGTLRYMAPERFDGRVDPRSDVFSLGLTLYEMATLQPAFSASGRAQMVERLLREQPPRPRKLDSRIPADLETLILKAIAKEPDRRYQTAGALADDLRRFLADRPILARRSGWVERFGRWCRRNPALAALSAAVIALLATLAVVGAMDTARLRSQLGETLNAKAVATDRLYRSLVEQARASRLSRGIGQRFNSLKVLAEATAMAREMALPESAFLELRTEAIACLALPDLRVAKEWDGLPDGTLSIEFDETLEHYVRADRQGVISIRRVAGDVEVYRLPGFGPGEAFPIFSPDGQFLLLPRSGRVKLWKLTGVEPIVILDERPDVRVYAFSADSRRVAIGMMSGAIELYDLSSGQLVRQFDVGTEVRGIAFHPGGNQLALSGTTGVQIRDLATGAVVDELPEPKCGAQLAWNPDGKSLACRSGRAIHVWDVPTRTRVVDLEGHRSDGVRFSYNRAGDRIASTCWDGTLRIWDVGTGQQCFSARTSVTNLTFGPGDHMLAAAGDANRLWLWEAASARGYRTFARVPAADQRDYYDCAVSPNNRLLAVGMSDGVGLWDLDRGVPVGGDLSPSRQGVLFEPDGALLTTGPTGLLRWPIEVDRAAPMAIHVGPPDHLPLPAAAERVAISRDGSVMASAEGEGALLWRRDRPGLPVRLADHKDTRFVSVSPDGCWVATGSHWGTKVKLWDAKTGIVIHELPLEFGSDVCFSPDGRWLATTGGGCRLWAVGTWAAGPTIGPAGPVAFSPDGKVLAIDTVAGSVRLVDPETGRDYARLEDPNRDRAHSLTFSPDGTRLVATTNDSHAIHVWDLRVIREQLAEMGLDWD